MDLNSTTKNSSYKKNKSYLCIINDKENSNAKNLCNSTSKKPETVKSILKSLDINKNIIDLKNMRVADDDMKYICLKISQMDNIRSVDLGKNNITDIGLKILLKSIKSK